MRHTKVLIVFIVLILGSIVYAQSETVAPESFADEDGQFIEVNDATLYVIDRGESDAPVVMLLHGFGGSTFSWRYTIDPLVEAGYRVIAFDRPPYGLADKSTDIDYSAANYVELTAGLMDSLNVESATLVGHSAGGGVIANFWMTYPERVDALVFVAGAVRTENITEFMPEQGESAPEQSVFAPLFSIVSRLDPDAPAARQLVERFITPDVIEGIVYGNYYDQALVTQEVLDGYTQAIRVDNWQGAFLKLLSTPEGIVEGQDYSPFAEIDIPVLIMWGEEDAVVPFYVGQALNAYMPDSELVAYPLTGHLPMEEATDAFNDDLLRFLNQNVYGE